MMKKLDLLCGNDELRPIMQFVLMNKENCVSTNAHVIGIVPTSELFNDEFIKELGEDQILCHKEDWKKMNNATCIEWTDRSKLMAKIHYKKNRPAIIQFVKDDGEEGKYPNWSVIIPNKDGMMDSCCINPTLLLSLSKALGYENGTLISYCGAENRALLVEDGSRNSEDTKSYGIIMPIMKNSNY